MVIGVIIIFVWNFSLVFFGSELFENELSLYVDYKG